ncbi:hypothetical protein CK498_21535 [Halomonas salipaludis]|uniref:Hpr(Ser) kinase/phosphatase n=1 Tax=Halomonas salipaludis TaxID=2032625 RepID=A0A2A2EQS0_9GAMM|nr:hypothetical protein CK498_21535 [Halomonas salipaludis]
MSHRYLIFGQRVSTERRFRTPMTSVAPSGEPDLRFDCRVVCHAASLAADACLYASPDKNHYGESAVQLYAVADGYVMRFPRVADFTLTPGHIDCQLRDPALDYMVEVCLLGHVFSCYLELSGITALHAGAVEVDGRAVLFAADRTGGKSTLVTSLVEAGFALLADDISALTITAQGARCLHGFPQLKMTPEQARRFVTGEQDYPLVHPAFTKLSVPLQALGRAQTEPLPVAAIYLLAREREAGPDARTQIMPVPASEAVMHLARHSFLWHLLETQRGGRAFAPGAAQSAAADLRIDRFMRLSRIAAQVPVRHLHYPSGYQWLPDVHQAIVDDVTTL